MTDKLYECTNENCQFIMGEYEVDLDTTYDAMRNPMWTDYICPRCGFLAEDENEETGFNWNEE